MKLIFILAALLHMCTSSSRNAICNSLYSEPPLDSPECIQRVTDNSDDEGNVTCSLDTEITWSVVDSDAGIVTFELNLPPGSCKFEAYNLELCIDESISDPEMCTNTSLVETHSKRYLTIKRQPEPNRILPDCDKAVNITFRNVYSGCYMLDIEPELENHKKAKSEDGDMLYQFKGPMFIQTNYTKTLLVNDFPIVSTQYLPSTQALRFVYTINELNVLKVEFESRVCKNSTTRCGRGSRQHYWEMALSNSGNYMCLNKGDASLAPTCHMDKDDNVMRCYLYNVTTPGYYCVLVQFIDDRCEPYTVWYNKSVKNNCLFSSKLGYVVPGIIETNSTIPVLPTSGHVINILVSVFVVVGLILVGVFIYLWRKRKPSPELEPRLEKQFSVKHKPRILLLYALDCKPFMTLMATFRDVLKDATKCEVYDCFDPEWEEEIARSKTDWLRQRIETSKVIVVESKCAVLHQNALFKQGKIMYKESVSNWMDDLFVYGLKTLADSCIGKNAYQRIFVVQINGFSETNYKLKHITPYTRYEIPQNLENLLTHLYQLNYSEYEPCITDENVDIGKLKLRECIKNLENYRTETPDYLNMLFVKKSDQEVQLV